MNRKIYARQVPPEYQESPLFMDDFIPESIALVGNRNYKEIAPEIFKDVRDVLESGELQSDIDDFYINPELARYETIEQAIMDYLPPKNRTEYTMEEIEKLTSAVQEYGYPGTEQENLCMALEIVTGEPWDYGTLRGTCQSDWQEIYYLAERWDDDALRIFEIEYFNMGTEWEIHVLDSEPETPEDVIGYCIYCHGWDDEQIKREIADEQRGAPEDVILYSFTGWTRTANWSIA